MRPETIKLEWSPGVIYDKLKYAVDMAKQYQCDIEFPFNGVTVIVNRNSNPDDFGLVLNAVKRKLKQVFV